MNEHVTDETRENLTDGSIWVRGFQMILFIIAFNVSEMLLMLITVFQWFSALITGRVNEPLLGFSKNASVYVQEVLEFLTFNSEIRPFPFTPWPDEAHSGSEWLDEEDEAEELAAEIDELDAEGDEPHNKA